MLVVHNESALLECIPVVPPDEPNARIRWFRVRDSSNHPLTESLPLENTTYRIESASEDDDGRYMCVLTTDYSGTQDADITLKVVSKSQNAMMFLSNDNFYPPPAKPLIISQTTAMTEHLGSTTTIFCHVTSKSGVNFTWHFNGNVLQPGERLVVDTERLISSVQIENMTYAEAGNYTCMATNIAGTAAHTTAVTILGKSPASIIVGEGMPGNLAFT